MARFVGDAAAIGARGRTDRCEKSQHTVPQKVMFVMNSQRPVGEVGAARTRSDVRIDSNPRHARWQRDGRATKIVSASHEQSFLEEYTVFMNINRLALPLVMLLVSGISACRTSPVTDTAPHGPEAEIRSMLDQYFADFNDGRPEAIPGVWHLPGWVASGTRNLLLASESVWFFSARRQGRLLAVGALRTVEEGHVEIKSMHTVEGARGQGVGRAMLEHLLTTAGDRGCRRVSLETGTGDAFAPARSLYRRSGFEIGPPFGDYGISPDSVCMTLDRALP